MAVLVASSELEELLWICHRIAVMNHGRVVAVLPPHRGCATKERIPDVPRPRCLNGLDGQVSAAGPDRPARI